VGENEITSVRTVVIVLNLMHCFSINSHVMKLKQLWKIRKVIYNNSHYNYLRKSAGNVFQYFYKIHVFIFIPVEAIV